MSRSDREPSEMATASSRPILAAAAAALHRSAFPTRGETMASGFPHLFSPYALRYVPLGNRIVSTAHGTYMLKDGLQTEQIAAYQAARAKGGVGLRGDLDPSHRHRRRALCRRGYRCLHPRLSPRVRCHP